MNLQEQTYRIKQIMGLLTEESNEKESCYPSDYVDGKKYDRDKLSEIFTCFAGPKFPEEGVKEWLFPLIPSDKGHVSPYYDPKNWEIGPNEFTNMEDFVNKYKSQYSNMTLENISVTPDLIHPDTKKFIKQKRKSVGYYDRVKIQMERVRKNGVESLTASEPFVVIYDNGLYKWEEGWHRMLTLLELYEKGEIKSISGLAWVINKINL